MAFLFFLSDFGSLKKKEFIQENPFYAVTNREFSLFLWQNPEFMRVNAQRKSGYLSAFQYLNSQVTVEPELADKYVDAPEEVLFFYHAWNRLIGDIFIPRPIPPKEFKQFLQDDEQWKPEFWKEAPQGYKELIESPNSEVVLQEKLPQIVQKAFVGWKNFMLEGDKINQLKVNYSQLDAFLAKYPTFKRPYWINFFREKRPHYLQYQGTGSVPDSELDGLIKLYLFNYFS